MRHGDGHGHIFGRLVAGIAEHHALIARADVRASVLGAALERIVHAHGDVAGLLVERGQHGAGLAVKAVFGAVIADVEDFLARDFVDRHARSGADFAHDQHKASGGAALAGDVRIGILCEYGVQNGVGNLVADFVGMSFGHGFRGKQSAHGGVSSFPFVAFERMAQKKRGLKDKPHENNPMRLIFQQCYLLRELAPLLTNQPVAGFHRARPSTSLDKASIQFTYYYTPVLPEVKLNHYGGIF